MEIPISPEMEAQISRWAVTMGRAADQVAAEMLAKQLEYDIWFSAEVQKGIKQLEGRHVTHEEVERRMARYLEPYGDPLA